MASVTYDGAGIDSFVRAFFYAGQRYCDLSIPISERKAERFTIEIFGTECEQNVHITVMRRVFVMWSTVFIQNFNVNM